MSVSPSILFSILSVGWWQNWLNFSEVYTDLEKVRLGLTTFPPANSCLVTPQKKNSKQQLPRFKIKLAFAVKQDLV